MNAYQMVTDVYRAIGAPNALNNPTNPIEVNLVLDRLVEGEIAVLQRLRQPRLPALIASVAAQVEYPVAVSVLSDMVISVEVKTGGVWSLPLEFTTLERLREDFDLTAATTGQTPMYYYYRYDDAATVPCFRLGIYPAPTASAADSIRMTYVPKPAPVQYLWGTSIYGCATTATIAANTLTLSTGSPLLAQGLEVGIVSVFGGAARNWYTITALGTPTNGLYTTATISPASLEPDTTAGKKFVISGSSTLSRAYPSVARAAIAWAAASLAEDGNNERSSRLWSQSEALTDAALSRVKQGDNTTDRLWGRFEATLMTAKKAVYANNASV